MKPAPGRFSLAILMGFIAVLAVGLGLMRNGSWLASRITLAVVPVALLVGLLGALVRRGEPGWVGFALFGWSYAWVAFASPPDSEFGRRVNPVVDLVDELVGALHPEPGPGPAAPVFNPRFQGMIGDRIQLRSVGTGPYQNAVLFSLLSPSEVATLNAFQSDLAAHDSMMSEQAARTAGAGVIGHALFTLVFALVGSIVGRALARHPEARTSGQPG